MYVMQASPLSRIFLPRWQRELIAKPALIFELKEKFEVIVPRASGAIRLWSMKPVHMFNLLPKKAYTQDAEGKLREVKGARQGVGDETRDLVPWLTGGPDGMGSEETDIYGIVQLDIGTDVVSDMVELMQRRSFEPEVEDDDAGEPEAGEAAEGAVPITRRRKRDGFAAQLVKMQAEYQRQVDAAVKRARAIADEKVRRALKITHANLVAAWDAMETDGKKPYLASAAEGLGAFILNEEIAASNASRQAMHGLLNRNVGPVVNG